MSTVSKRLPGFAFTATAILSLLLGACSGGERNNPADPGGTAFSTESSAATSSATSSAQSSSSGVSSAAANTFRDTRGSGETYGYTTIGDLVWMTENLRHRPAGRTTWCLDDDDGECLTRGRLYTWATAMNLPETCNENAAAVECGIPPAPLQGVCPPGWHLPAQDEWESLKTHLIGVLGAEGQVGSALKSSRGWIPAGTNDFSFDAIPAGYRQPAGAYSGQSDYARFWTSTPDVTDDYNAWEYFLLQSSGELFTVSASKVRAISVRCVRDPEM